MSLLLLHISSIVYRYVITPIAIYHQYYIILLLRLEADREVCYSLERIVSMFRLDTPVSMCAHLTDVFFGDTLQRGVQSEGGAVDWGSIM